MTKSDLLRSPIRAGAVGLGIVALLHFRDPHSFGSYGYCPFLYLTGHPCPGCGGLRAINHLSHGEWTEALGSNAVVVVLAGILALAWAVWFSRRARGVAAPLFSIRPSWIYGVLAVIIAFGIFRNTPWGAGLAP